MRNKLQSEAAYWENISEPERMMHCINIAAAQIAYNRSLREDLTERVEKMTGGRMNTWPDGYERLMLAARARVETLSTREDHCYIGVCEKRSLTTKTLRATQVRKYECASIA